MKLALLLATILVLTTPPSSFSAEGRLKGCPDPSTIAKALAKLQQSNWKDLSVGRIQAIWPTDLLGIDCDSEACSSLGSKGRIIDGHYECSEAFYFDVQRSQHGTVSEQLRNIIIHYSAHQRNEVVTAAKRLARAAGLAEAEVVKVGRNSKQDFYWESVAKQEISGLNLELTRRGRVWTLYFNFSRFPM